MKSAASILAASFLALAACDGPREQAGEKADAASGATNSEDAMESGPAETMGERQDETAETAAEAREAKADSLEATAEEQREAAEQQAEALEEQAKKVRGE